MCVVLTEGMFKVGSKLVSCMYMLYYSESQKTTYKSKISQILTATYLLTIMPKNQQDVNLTLNIVSEIRVSFCVRLYGNRTL